MNRVIYRAAAAAEPPLLDTVQSSPPTIGEVVAISLDSLNLQAFSPAVQESLRLSAVSRWEVLSTERHLHKNPASPISGDFHEAVVRPILATSEPAR